MVIGFHNRTTWILFLCQTHCCCWINHRFCKRSRFSLRAVTSATGLMALGKLAGHNMATSLITCTGSNSESLEKSDISSRSENKSSLFDVIQSILQNLA